MSRPVEGQSGGAKLKEGAEGRKAGGRSGRRRARRRACEAAAGGDVEEEKSKEREGGRGTAR